MADFFRPEARATVQRWAETAAALTVTGVGLWWAVTGPGIVHWAGGLLAALGAGLSLGAIQRARFKAQGQGTGLIEVVEGEIRYFGPRGGGIVALDHVLIVSLSADAQFWLLESLHGEILAIPRAAEGHQRLFDAFSGLPGFDMARLLRITGQGPAPRARMIWRHPDRRLLT